MAIGMLVSAGLYSNKTYTGSVITDRFTATTQNQQLILFTNKAGKQVNLNSLTIEADTADLYFTLVGDINTVGYDFTGDPVFVCKAGESLFIGGVQMTGIKFSNASGARYFIQATRY